MTPRALAALGVVAATALTTPALAVLADPSEAQANVDAARATEAMAFCRAPRRPLSARARELCPTARAVPDCAGFATACDAAQAKRPADSERPWHASLKKALGALAQGLVVLLAAAAFAALVYPIVQALRRRRRDASLADEPATSKLAPHAEVASSELPAVDDAESALRRADDLAQSGELNRALFMYLAASLAALDRRGAVRIARSRTNGEYVRACSETERRPALRELVREVDRAQFSGEPPTTDRVSRASGLARALVRVAPTTLAALAVVLLVGCGANGIARHADPGGDELFADLLTRQGLAVSTTGRALSNLAPLTASELDAAPVLVVDLDRTPLEPDAETRVVAWVESGGVLVLAGTTSQALSNAFGYRPGPAALDATGVTAIDGLLSPLEPPQLEDDDDEDVDLDTLVKRAHAAREAARRRFRGAVHGSGAVAVEGGEPIIVVAAAGDARDARVYAAAKPAGKGVVVALPDGELFTNVGLSRPGNPSVVAALFTELMARPAYPGGEGARVRQERAVRLARAGDGISPPGNPFSSLARAGLGLGMGHAFVACLLLFAAYGSRHARPRPAPPPARRAFSEHILATGAFYARLARPAHALAVFARFAELRLRRSLPRGATDIPSFLAARTRAAPAASEALWARALAVEQGAAPRGDELAVLRELRASVAASLAPDVKTSAAAAPSKDPT